MISLWSPGPTDCHISMSLQRSSSGRFDIPAPVLVDYWNLFSYGFGEEEQKGLMTYYDYAASIGAIKTVKDLQILEKKLINGE